MEEHINLLAFLNVFDVIYTMLDNVGISISDSTKRRDLIRSIEEGTSELLQSRLTLCIMLREDYNQVKNVLVEYWYDQYCCTAVTDQQIPRESARQVIPNQRRQCPECLKYHLGTCDPAIVERNRKIAQSNLPNHPSKTNLPPVSPTNTTAAQAISAPVDWESQLIATKNQLEATKKQLAEQSVRLAVADEFANQIGISPLSAYINSERGGQVRVMNRPNAKNFFQTQEQAKQ
jgi:hypothetical protein